jgi:hypothetical protein
MAIDRLEGINCLFFFFRGYYGYYVWRVMLLLNIGKCLKKYS